MLSSETAWKFAEYGRNVWGITEDDDMTAAKRAIAETAGFFYDTLGMPETLSAVGVDREKLSLMAESAGRNLGKAFVPLTAQDVLEIYQDSFEPFEI